MTPVLRKVGVGIERRELLRRAAGATFGLIAAAAVGRSPSTTFAGSACCDLPGGRSCGCACNGLSCGNCLSLSCEVWEFYWPGSGCWESTKGCPGVWCCDCQCFDEVEWQYVTCGCEA